MPAVAAIAVVFLAEVLLTITTYTDIPISAITSTFLAPYISLTYVTTLRIRLTDVQVQCEFHCCNNYNTFTDDFPTDQPPLTNKERTFGDYCRQILEIHN